MTESLEGYSPEEVLPTTRWCSDNLPGFKKRHLWLKPSHLLTEGYPLVILCARFEWKKQTTIFSIQSEQIFEGWIMKESPQFLGFHLARFYAKNPDSLKNKQIPGVSVLGTGVRDKILNLRAQGKDGTAQLYFPRHALCFSSGGGNDFRNGYLLYPSDAPGLANGPIRTINQIDVEASRRRMSVTCIEEGGTLEQLESKKIQSVRKAVDDLMRLKEVLSGEPVCKKV
jgi:hypothetical protein